MRKRFAEFLHARMAANPRLRLLTADLGYGVLDRIRIDYPDRWVDFGAAEQLMVGAACGMKLCGLEPVCYSIAPFLLYRPFEWLRNFLHHDQIGVKLVGVGRDDDYKELGFTHWAGDDALTLAALPHIRGFWPASPDERTFDEFLNHEGPAYMNLAK